MNISKRLSQLSFSDWMRGAIGGFFGSIPFGFIMMYVMSPPVLEMAIPAMYGIEGPALAAGWVFHLFHGTTMGLSYVAIFEASGFIDQDTLRSIGGGIGFGVLWGFLITAVMAVMVMPIWLKTIGFGGAPPFPNIGFGTLISLMGHVIWAVILGITYGGIPTRTTGKAVTPGVQSQNV